MKYFCIFGGGGIRGAAYSGAIKALNELNIEITGLAGSSIGAVVAGLLAVGYSHDEINDVFENINFEFFKDINFTFGKDFALSKGNNFYEWIKEKTENKFYAKNPDKKGSYVTFADLDKELVIFSVDLSTSKFVEFSKTKTPDVEIAHAIRVSVAMPGLYSPVAGQNECLVDGDLLKSSPLFLISDTIKNQKEKILEYRLENNETRRKITNTIEYLNAVYDVVSGFATDNLIKKYENSSVCDFIKLNLDNISVVDFMTSKENKALMADIGYEKTIDYFKNKYPEKIQKLNNIYEKISLSLNKILYFIKKSPKDALYELSNLVADMFEYKEILDDSLIESIISLKQNFEQNYFEKNALFRKKGSFIDKDSLINRINEILSLAEDKITKI